MNSILIDTIFVAFLLLISFLGYRRGFITRLYDLLTTVIVLFLTILLTPYLSQTWSVYKYDNTDSIATMLGTFINYIFVFIIIFIIFIVIKKFFGLLMKPLIKTITDKFKVTSFVDKTLGVLLSLIEGIFITYLVLILAFIPFNSSSKVLLDGTLLTKQVLKIVPDVSAKVIDLSEMFHNSQMTTASSLQTMTGLLLIANNLNIINKDMTSELLKESIVEELKKEKITLTSSQIQDLEDLLKNTGYNGDEIKLVLKNINVSGGQ